MKNLIRQNSLQILVVTGAILMSLLVFSSFADARDSRDRSEVRDGEEVVQPTPAPTPAPIHIDNGSSSGSISSDTNADVDTGGNTGGKVTTGDESARETEVNVGPTNPSAAPPEEEKDAAPTVPEESCDGRTRINCDTESPSRER